ncbi:MAG: alpha/beta hydrolase [Bacilli bacterium]|nr:alpha/beta hydrolase [Bacilli bacterium]
MFYYHNGINIYYEKYGCGKPIIFLHGWGCSLGVFKHVVSAIKNKYEIFLIDLPGFGKSSNLEIPLDVKEVTKVFKDFISKHNIINPILIGHSYGGRILIEYASSSLNIDKLILIDSAGIKHKSIKKWIKIKLYKLKKHYFKLTKQVMKYNELLVNSGSSDYINSSHILKQMLIKAVTYDQKKLLKNIPCETLIIWGENDNTTKLKDAKVFKRLIKKSELVIIPSSSHFPFIDNYSYFIKVLKSYLEV